MRNKARIDVAEEFGWNSRFALPPFAPLARAREKNLFSRPRKRHVKEPTLFFRIAVIVAGLGEQTLLEPRYKYNVKFETFRCVDRHEHRAAFVLIERILIGHEGCFF